MKLSLPPVWPCMLAKPTLQNTTSYSTLTRCYSILTQPAKFTKKYADRSSWEHLLDPIIRPESTSIANSRPEKLSDRWMEYQGIGNWEGLLDPLDDNLRREILRYGNFVEATYKSFDFDPSSPTYATCRFPKSTLLERSGLSGTGYRLTKHLRATSGIQLPRWMEKVPSWMSTKSSWVGYVAVCQDKDAISRLGRRDVVISFRGTATCLEWLENLRATLAPLAFGDSNDGPMVESGFLSLYISGTEVAPSLQEMVKEEIKRVLETYNDEPLSLTITGHSLGAALAILTAYDIKKSFKSCPLVTVMSFGGPRVGNLSFGQQLESQGTKVLRIVNTNDVITKVPGFVVDDSVAADKKRQISVPTGLPSWIQKRVHDTQWLYAEVGRELRLCSKESSFLDSVDVARCHDLKTYLHLVDGFVSTTCPLRATARRVLGQSRNK